jgi:hypothetical protein
LIFSKRSSSSSSKMSSSSVYTRWRSWIVPIFRG